MVPILSTLVFLPIVGALLILFFPRESRLIRILALLTTGAVLAVSIVLLLQFDAAQTQMQFVEKTLWVPAFNIWYFVGVDGLSVGLLFLTALLGFLACVASKDMTRPKEYYILYLLLMTGMTGTFVALDLVLFYIFWEIVLIPMYFLIGIWGGPRREYAAIKFLVYTLAGSVVMLVGILVAYFHTDPHTFNILELQKAASHFDFRLQVLLFLAFYLAFAIKVPIFPFHTWLPDAHVEAPTPISVLLAGVLLKMGGYGFFRIAFPCFPQAVVYLLYPLAILAVINIVYGAAVAFTQSDFKKLVAYSSVSHMGFVILGLAALNTAGWNGALLEMFNHGIITGGMFLLVGVLYDRSHTRDLGSFGGLSATMPVYAFFLTMCSLASFGLPGLAGFVGEFLSLIGAWPAFPVLTIISVIGLVVIVGYFLLMIQRVLLGPMNSNCRGYVDMNPREVWTMVPLMAITFVVGVYPKVILKFQEASVQEFVRLLS